MTLRELIDRATSIGRQVSSAEIPAYINGVEKIESIELSRMNNGNLYANINTKKSQRMVSAEAKEALYDKPAWSEEEKDDLNNIIWLCNNCINGSETTWIPSQATRIKSLIERIKDTVFLQPRQEWNEEDEKMMI